MSVTPQAIREAILKITGPGEFFEIESRQLSSGTFPAYKHAAANLIDLLQSVRNHGDLDFLVYENERLSYSGFFQRVDSLAAAMQHDLGIQPGDRIAIAMRNCPDWCVGFTAAILVGAIVVPINSWGKTEELHFAVTDCGARCLIADPQRVRLIAPRLDELSLQVLTTGDVEPQAGVQSFEAVLDSGKGRSYEVVSPAAEDLCLILYTSGSTGFPKGVAHNHVAVCQSLMNMMFLGYLLMTLEGPRELRGGAERESPMLTVPLFHATGLLSGFLMPAMTAQKAVMMYKWDSEKALQLIQTEKITNLSTVPAILKDLLNHPKFDDYDTRSLSRVAGAGAATPTGLPELIEEKLGAVSRSAGYGMTETMAVAATMSGAIFDLKPNSAGIPSPIMAFRFAAADDTLLAEGEQGEIQLRGITCTPGYWEKPEANAKTFTADGWLRTGDVGMIDADGFLHITGRIKEIVIRGGENIYPGEIENTAYRHEAAQEVVVFGVDDADMGEELAMVCYLRPGFSLDEPALRSFLGQHLAGYKVPKHIRFAARPLPRNASEKLHKLKVREMFLNGELD